MQVGEHVQDSVLLFVDTIIYLKFKLGCGVFIIERDYHVIVVIVVFFVELLQTTWNEEYSFFTIKSTLKESIDCTTHTTQGQSGFLSDIRQPRHTKKFIDDRPIGA